MDLRFYFGEDRRLPCPFPIVKAISVRPQYFKDETKQSICVGNQKSPLVSPFSKEQGFGSSSSRDLPFPHPTLLGPCVISQGASVYVYVCGGEPSCTPIVCLFLFLSWAGWSFSRASGSWARDRQGPVQGPQTSLDPECDPPHTHLKAGKDISVKKRLSLHGWTSKVTAQYRAPGGWVVETKTRGATNRQRTQPCKNSHEPERLQTLQLKTGGFHDSEEPRGGSGLFSPTQCPSGWAGLI